MAWGFTSPGFTGLRIPTRVVGASNSVNKHKADYICTGTNDDVTINAALNSLPSTGGWVYLLDGTYNISSGITIPVSDIKLSGAGKSTRIETTSNIRMISATQLYRLMISDLYLQGASTTSGRQDGIYWDNVQHSSIEGCIIDSCSYNIRFTNQCNSNIIANNRVTNAVQTGIFFALGEPAAYAKILNNTIAYCGQHGIVLGPLSLYCLVDGNSIGHNGYNGIDMTNADYNIVTNNLIGSNSRHGVEMSLSDRNAITDNQITANNYHGIYVHSFSDDNVISSNLCVANDSGDTATYDGINIDDDCDTNIISSNRCTGNGRYGYYIVNANCDNNVVVSNILTGNTTASFTDSGTNTLMVANAY